MEKRIKKIFLCISILALTCLICGSVFADNSDHEKTYAGLDANTEYVFLVVKDPSLNPVLIEDNLLYIDQKCSDSNGVVTFNYQPKGGEEGTELICGNGKSIEAVVSSGNACYMSLAAAIQSVPDNTETTIKINGNLSESIVISKNQIINIDLNGYTLSSGQPEQSAINNYGTLNIGNGVIDGTVENEGKLDGIKDSSEQLICASYKKQINNRGSVRAGIFYHAIINVNAGSIDNTNGNVKIIYNLDGTDCQLSYGYNLKTALNQSSDKRLFYILKDYQLVGEDDLVSSEDLTLRQISSVTIKTITGDINRDGIVDIMDSRLAKRIAMKDGTVDYTKINFDAGDLDKNGKITINEVRNIKRVVLKESSFE